MKMAMKIITLLVAFPFVFFTFVAGSYAGSCGSSDDGSGTSHATGSTPWTADSCSYADVTYCVNTAASSGDTVIVPAGTATWKSRLGITKGITLQGAGIGQTVITNGVTPGYDDQCLGYVPASPELDETFRLTGFTFDGNNINCLISVGNKNRNVITNVRIDHNRFQNSGRNALYFNGEIYGLVDNNHFEDNYANIKVVGYYWYSWWDLSPPSLGSADYLYFEDNTFNFTDAFWIAHPGWGQIISSGGGAKWVLRHNTITNFNKGYDVMDVHGNQQPVTEDYSPYGSRGVIAVEIYNNSLASFKVGGGHRFLNHRGGTAIVFNNSITGSANSIELKMIEEDGTARSNFLSERPGWDPVQNTYYYNNTLNGDVITPRVDVNSAVFIHENRDYFLVNPVGQTIGGSVYTPYQYPHPMARPSTPANLRIVE